MPKIDPAHAHLQTTVGDGFPILVHVTGWEKDDFGRLYVEYDLHTLKGDEAPDFVYRKITAQDDARIARELNEIWRRRDYRD